MDEKLMNLIFNQRPQIMRTKTIIYFYVNKLKMIEFNGRKGFNYFSFKSSI